MAYENLPFNNDMVYQGSYPAIPKFRSTTPYAYDMNSLNPQPMNPAPQQTLPPLQPSMMTPQLTPPKPFSNPNMDQSQYADGGSVSADWQDYLPQNPTGYAYGGHVPTYAQGGLNDLAEMLQMLQMQQMESGNPYASQNNPYGDMNHEMYRLGDDNKPHYKKGGIFKKVARFGLPIIGGIVGGPLGAGIGGALGAKISGKNPLKEGLMSAGLGMLGGAMFGGAGPSAGTIGGGLGNLFARGTAAGAGAAGAGAGASGIGNIFSRLGMNKMSDFLLPGAIAGMALAKKRIPEEKHSMAEMLQAARPQWSPEQMPKKVLPMERVMKILESGEYAPEYFEDTNPEIRYGASGGLGRYLEGGTGGQDDSIDAKLSDGEYVISADVVSDLGDGNNKAGAVRLDHFMHAVRKHKDSKRDKKGLPPKAKSLDAYMTARR